jgi:CheY-like chemotaxis protein
MRRDSAADPLRVVVLEALGACTGEGDLADELAFVSKPIRRAALYRALSSGAAPETAGNLQPQKTSAPHGDVPILLVEDNAINRNLAASMLETRGWRVDTAVDGVEAVAAAQEKDYEVVLMDWQMPRMNGLEATRAIRERETRDGARRTPIIALTANAMVGDDRACIESGMERSRALRHRTLERGPPRRGSIGRRWCGSGRRSGPAPRG